LGAQREVEQDTAFSRKAKNWGIKNESAAVEVYAALRLNKSVMPNHTYAFAHLNPFDRFLVITILWLRSLSLSLSLCVCVCVWCACCRQYRHKTHRWLLGMPDALIVDTKTGKVEGILEVKCPFTKDMNTYAIARYKDSI
jgi:hypothetical protein